MRTSVVGPGVFPILPNEPGPRVLDVLRLEYRKPLVANQWSCKLKTLVDLLRNGGEHWVGDGFPVRTVFAYEQCGRELSPFLLLDYAGPYRFEPAARARGIGPHPHRGFETVTLVYDGELSHRDTTGRGGIIGPGDVQWMTAGSGVIHQEFHSAAFTENGGLFRAVQLWVNLPATNKLAPPRYQSIKGATIPIIALDNHAGSARAIAGSLRGQQGPATTFTPLNVWDLELKGETSTLIEAPEGHTTLVVVLYGRLAFGGGAEVRDAEAALLSRDGVGVVLAADGPTKVLLLTGEPISEPIVGRGPFVMNTEVQIRQAFRDFGSGRFGATGR
jgi:quercetin 2,3-dioxygenase